MRNMDNPAACREPAVENQFAEILVESEENPLLSRAKRRDILIRDAGALFRDRNDVPASL